MTEKKSRLVPVVTIIAAIVAAAISSAVVTRLMSGPSSLDRSLVLSSAEINKSCPMVLDQDTRLDTTHVEPEKTLVYSYTLVNLETTSVDKQKFVELMRPKIVANYRTNESMKSFRAAGVTMKYRYSDKNGIFVAEMAVNPKDL